MDEKRKSKRIKLVEDSLWECSVCTYRNSPEAFKCEMCDVRKGTSTRKPQINPQVVAQQMSQPVFKKEKLVTPKPKMPTESQKDENALKVAKKKKSSQSSNKHLIGSSIEVTVGNVSVIITDCPPIKARSTSVNEGTSCKESPSYAASSCSDAENSLDGSSRTDKSFTSAVSSPTAE